MISIADDLRDTMHRDGECGCRECRTITFAADEIDRLRAENAELKAAIEFILPLFRQTAGADDQAPLQITPNDQFLDQQPGHDGFARPRVVRQQEPQRLAWQHGLVDGGDLVGQWLDQRGMHGQERVEQVRQMDTVGL